MLLLHLGMGRFNLLLLIIIIITIIITIIILVIIIVIIFTQLVGCIGLAFFKDYTYM